MTDLPAPPVPADCDLRGMPGFMLDTERLMASELWALADGPTFKAAVGLWCRAWRQVPASSLPDDDAVLRAFAGMPASAWKKAKDMALRGFVKCSDGRLYHLVLAEDAARAWGHRQMQREKAGKRWGTALAMPRHSHGTPTALPKQCQGQGQGQRQEVEADASTASASAAAAPSTDFLTDDPTGKTAQVIPPGGTLGDLQAMHPALLVPRDDRDQATRLLALYGWDACAQVLRELTAEAQTRPANRRRIFPDALAARLAERFDLLPEDYERAGLTPPPKA